MHARSRAPRRNATWIDADQTRGDTECERVPAHCTFTSRAGYDLRRGASRNSASGVRVGVKCRVDLGASSSVENLRERFRRRPTSIPSIARAHCATKPSSGVEAGDRARPEDQEDTARQNE